MTQLMTLEKLTGRRTLDNFDWIAGTSTGGILASGLAAGLFFFMFASCSSSFNFTSQYNYYFTYSQPICTVIYKP